MFDFMKQMAKENQDYILLYIYANFIIQNDKNKNKKLNEKMIWIVNFCLEKEQLSPFLFEILQKIFEYEQKYIQSTNIAQNIISSQKLSLNEQLYYFSLIDLKDKKPLFNDLFEKFLSLEKIIILSREEEITYSKALYNKIKEKIINYFQDITIYNFEKEDFWKKFEKILEILIKYYNSIIKEIKKPENKIKFNNMLLENSVICQILFLLINILLFKAENLTNKNEEIEFFKLLLKTLIISGKNIKEEKSIEHDIEKEEIIIFHSECFDNPESFDMNLPIKPGNIYMKYDIDTNYPYKLTIGKLPTFMGCPEEFEEKDISQGNNWSNISILNNIKANLEKEYANEYKKLRIKFSNFKNDESNTNILVEIRKSILFFILISSMIKCKINKIKSKNNQEKDDEKEILKEKINQIIKIKLF